MPGGSLGCRRLLASKPGMAVIRGAWQSQHQAGGTLGRPRISRTLQRHCCLPAVLSLAESRTRRPTDPSEWQAWPLSLFPTSQCHHPMVPLLRPPEAHSPGPVSPSLLAAALLSHMTPPPTRSAGIGRTGCFIATRIGCQQLQARGEVDILGIVCQLRLDRWVPLASEFLPAPHHQAPPKERAVLSGVHAHSLLSVRRGLPHQTSRTPEPGI